MKQSRYIGLILAAIISAATLTVTAQNSVVSPYSAFGYGILRDHVSSSQAAMGGVGYAMNNGRQINVMNPASYAAIDTLTFLFDIGIDYRYLSTSQAEADGKTSRGNNSTAGLNYITMQFPVTRYMGASIGLLPYSQTGYKFGNKVDNGASSISGSGTVNEVYVGLSGKLFKGMTVGVNASYLFGTLINDEYITSTSASTSLFERAIDIRDYNLSFGAQYSFNIGIRNRFTLGVVYSPKQSFHGHAEGVKYDTSLDTRPDTIGTVNLRGNASRPETYGGGINYQWNERIMVEADFTYQPWKGCKIPTLSNSKGEPVEGYKVLGTNSFNNRWKASVGFQYTPDPRGSYFHRVQYRAGAYLNRDYISVNGNEVKDLGFTCGLGLPAPINRFTKTVVNVGFEYRHRQASPISLVKENYFQVTVGINFNELWFWQNKIQ